MPTRRALMLGGAAGVAAAATTGVESGLLPGRHRLHRLLGMTGQAGAVPDVAPGRVIQGRFTSQARGGRRTAGRSPSRPASTPPASRS